MSSTSLTDVLMGNAGASDASPPIRPSLFVTPNIHARFDSIRFFDASPVLPQEAEGQREITKSSDDANKKKLYAIFLAAFAGIAAFSVGSLVRDTIWPDEPAIPLVSRPVTRETETPKTAQTPQPTTLATAPVATIVENAPSKEQPQSAAPAETSKPSAATAMASDEALGHKATAATKTVQKLALAKTHSDSRRLLKHKSRSTRRNRSAPGDYGDEWEMLPDDKDPNLDDSDAKLLKALVTYVREKGENEGDSAERVTHRPAPSACVKSRSPLEKTLCLIRYCKSRKSRDPACAPTPKEISEE